MHECEVRVQSFGGAVVKRYSDEGISGSHEAQRPQYLAMITAMKLGTFDAIMAEDMDRLNRNLEASARLYSLAVRDNVEIWTIADGRISQMHTGLKGLMGEMFLQQLGDKTRRGMMGKARAGTIMAGNCFGYDISGRGTRTINPEQAAVVRSIYRDYASGVSPIVIVTKLNAMETGTARGGKWRVSTLIGSSKRLNGVLNNPIYVGRPVFNRQHFVKDPETGKRIARPNPPDLWIHQNSPDLRIVSEEIWEQAQRRRVGKAGPRAANAKRRPKTLLSGIVRCEECGAPMSLNSGYFRCTEHINSGTCGMNRGVRADRLEAWVMDGLMVAMDDQQLISTYVKHLHDTVAKLEAQKAVKAEADARKVKELDRKISNIMDAIESGQSSPALMARLNVLEQERAGAQPELQAKPPKLPTRAIFDAGARYKSQIADLMQISASDPTSREIIRSMLARVSAGRVEDKISIEVDGNFGAIISYADHPESWSNNGCGSLQPALGQVLIPLVRRVA